MSVRSQSHFFDPEGKRLLMPPLELIRAPCAQGPKTRDLLLLHISDFKSTAPLIVQPTPVTLTITCYDHVSCCDHV